MSSARKSLMAKVHIARTNLGLDEETYRAMLDNLTGQRSAADCTDRQLVLVIAALRKRGWTDTRPKAPRVPPEYRAMLRKIDALRIETHKTWPYVEGIANHLYGIGLSWCDSVQLRGVITAMIKHRVACAAREQVV